MPPKPPLPVAGAGAGLSGPDLDLHELTQKVRAGNGDLYRHLALYLQVMRQVLPMRVERAVYHLATQVQPRRYAQLPADDRGQLHRRLRSLVHRCSSLLTVEQLVSLAAQMDRERERQERRERQRLLERFATAVAPLNHQRGAAGPGSAPGKRESDALPVGSVNLDGPPPFSAALLRNLIPGRPPGSLGLDDEEPEGLEEPGDHGDDARGDDPSHRLGGEPPEQSLADGGRGGMPPPAVLQRLLGDPEHGPRAAEPWADARLPENPVLLLRWLEGVEQSLARRLRNLSHAINVELLRAGLSGSLLPVSLLDGVLAGQIETQPSPPNLLRLRLPFPAEDANPLLVMAVLLRGVDLELEEPRLRTCRRRLQQHRQEVRRMAQQFRRLQRRCEAHEAEQLWLQDRRASLNPPG